MKKTTLLSLLGAAVLTSGTYAHETECCPPEMPKSPCCFQGFYVGGTVGYGSHKAETNQASTFASSYHNDLSLDGANGGLYLGYGREFGCSRVYLGLELGYYWDGARGQYAATLPEGEGGNLLKTDVKRKDGVELAARIGWVCNQTMPYIKLGWANTKLEAHQVVVDSNLPGNPLPAQKFLDKHVSGFLVGAGIDMKINRCWMAGLEYTYTNYGKENGSRQPVGSSAPVSENNYWSNSVKLSDNKFRLRLAYQF